jgi:hypothetical protein
MDPRAHIAETGPGAQRGTGGASPELTPQRRDLPGLCGEPRPEMLCVRPGLCGVSLGSDRSLSAPRGPVCAG